jgi:hypothetical protein
MKNVWKWILLGVVFFLLALCVAFPLMGGLAFMPMRGFFAQGMMSRAPMMGGFAYGGGFGWLALLIGAVRCLLPLAIVAGIIALIVYLVRRKPSTPPPALAADAASKPCPACGKSVQEGWVACPFCGQKL